MKLKLELHKISIENKKDLKLMAKKPLKVFKGRKIKSWYKYPSYKRYKRFLKVQLSIIDKLEKKN